MDFIRRFNDIQDPKIIPISDLKLNTEYSVISASRVDTKYGLAILLSLRQNSEHAVKIYLPRRFNSAFTEDDITSINNGQMALIFTYRGVSDRKAYIVNLRMQ
jgi:hypothetical protein